VESYFDTGDRADFNNDGGTIRLFPNLSSGLDAARNREARAAAPLVLTGANLDAARAAVAALAPVPGYRFGRAASRSL